MGGGGQSAAKFWDYRVAELEDGDKRGDRTEYGMKQRQRKEDPGRLSGPGRTPP